MESFCSAWDCFELIWGGARWWEERNIFSLGGQDKSICAIFVSSLHCEEKVMVLRRKLNRSESQKEGGDH